MQISTEYRKGILFIRLKGRIDNGSFIKSINNIINITDVSYIVLNLKDINDVSLDSIKTINNYNKKILKKKKHLFICDRKIRNRLFRDTIPKIENELEAFSLI